MVHSILVLLHTIPRQEDKKIETGMKIIMLDVVRSGAWCVIASRYNMYFNWYDINCIIQHTILCVLSGFPCYKYVHCVCKCMMKANR